MKTLYYNHITILKVFATIFITWFHFKTFTPTPINKLFIGGMLGNSLFFFCSGYLSSIKKEKYKGEWLVNKWIRIMPSIWIGTILLMSIRDVKIYNFIYPTLFWFINALLIFYTIFYAFNKLLTKFRTLSVFTIISMHSIYYLLFVNHNQVVMDGGGFKIWFYCFLFFLYGFYIKGSIITYNKYSIIKCIISIVIFYAYKELSEIYSILVFWQFIIQPIILFIFIHYALQSAFYISKITTPNSIKHILSYISNLTLEIYVTQITIINLVKQTNIRWQYKIIIATISIFVIACLCNKLSNKTVDIIKNYINKKIK